ncbi:MAG: DNA alkylation repair protein, partial [Bacteroidota bacterium]
MIPPEVLSRKGARKPADVPEAVLHYLHLGQIATANLSEWLAVDQRQLFAHVAEQLAFPSGLKAAVDRAIETAPKLSSNILVRIIGRTLDAEAPDAAGLQVQLDASESDVVRCWAAHMVGGRA